MLIYELSVPGPNFCKGDIFWVSGRPTLDTFVNNRSFLLWEVMRHTQQNLSWLEQPVDQWEQYYDYRELHVCINKFKVVNDTAERMVKLAAERISTVRSEDHLQFTILTVEELSKGYICGNFWIHMSLMRELFLYM